MASIKHEHVTFEDGSEIDLVLDQDDGNGNYVVMPLGSIATLAPRVFNTLQEANTYYEELLNYKPRKK